jgi:hypothetical protein
MGTGKANPDPSTACLQCSGWGVVTLDVPCGACGRCQGSGVEPPKAPEREPCPHCFGTGEVLRATSPVERAAVHCDSCGADEDASPVGLPAGWRTAWGGENMVPVCPACAPHIVLNGDDEKGAP